jgi:hypothetical protein
MAWGVGHGAWGMGRLATRGWQTARSRKMNLFQYISVYFNIFFFLGTWQLTNFYFVAH